VIEVADRELIAAILPNLPPEPSPGPRKKKAASKEPLQQARRSTRRCRCGLCPRCLENARWERIFQEKFADPYYYTRRASYYGSSLAWL